MSRAEGGARSRLPAWARLSRVTSGGSFIPEIDGLRFVAIALVILHHNQFVLRDARPQPEAQGTLWQAYDALGAAGGLGVPLFFVISGLILGLPFAKARLAGGRPVRLGAYFKRRLWRLEPPYIICLGLLFAMMVASGGADAFAERLPHFLASITYLHNAIYNAWSEINFVAWSLEVEAQFYILAPVFALVFGLGRVFGRYAAILGLIILGSLLGLFLQEAAFRLSHSLLAYGQYFFAGLLLADLMVEKRLYPAKPSLFFDVLAVGFFTLAVLSDLGWPHPSVQAFGAWPLLAFFLCVFRGRVWLLVFRHPVIYTIGGMCYTIYLYHFWIIRAVVDALGLDQIAYQPWSALVFDLVMMGVVFAVSAVLFALFERPFMFRGRPSGDTGNTSFSSQ